MYTVCAGDTRGLVNDCNSSCSLKVDALVRTLSGLYLWLPHNTQRYAGSTVMEHKGHVEECGVADPHYVEDCFYLLESLLFSTTGFVLQVNFPYIVRESTCFICLRQ